MISFWGKFRVSAISFSAIVAAGCAIHPTPIEQKEIVSTILDDQEKLYAHQVPISGQLTIGEVMARALRYNLAYRTERLKSAIAQNQFELAKYELLPTLAAEAGFLSRNNVNASRSVSIFTGNETLEPSTSQDRNRETANLRFSWNILNFGVSYLEAKQNADRYLISNHARSKVMSSILLQAYSAYWNALMAQELLPDVKEALSNARIAIVNIDSGLQAGAYRSPLDALQLKKQLLESVHELESLTDILNRSKIALANLINMPPREEFTLAKSDIKASFSFADQSLEAIELTALVNSADVVEQIYNARIDRLETRKAIARLFPGIELAYDNNYDSNSFSYNNHWGDASLRVSFNLLKLASTKDKLKNVKLREELTKQRRLAVSAAVITQLNLAMQQWKTAVRQRDQAASLKHIDDQIATITTQQAKGQKSVVEQVQAQVAALQTNMGFMSTRASVSSAEGTLFFTMGLSPIPKDHADLTLQQLSHHINSTLAQWYHGDFKLIDGVQTKDVILTTGIDNAEAFAPSE